MPPDHTNIEGTDLSAPIIASHFTCVHLWTPIISKSRSLLDHVGPLRAIGEAQERRENLALLYKTPPDNNPQETPARAIAETFTILRPSSEKPPSTPICSSADNPGPSKTSPHLPLHLLRRCLRMSLDATDNNRGDIIKRAVFLLWNQDEMKREAAQSL